MEDIQRYREVAPQDPWGVLDYFWTVIWLDWVTKGSPSNPQVVSATTKLIDSGVLDQTQRAYALVIRAAATNYAPDCQADLDEAIRLVPNGLPVPLRITLGRLLADERLPRTVRKR